MDNNAIYYGISRLYDSFATATGNKSRYFFMYDIERDIARWSPEAVSDFPLPGEMVHHQLDTLRELLAPEDASAFCEDLKAFSRGRLDKKDTQWKIRSREGRLIPCGVKCFAVKDYAGRPSYLAAAITSRGFEEHIDSVTGLPDHVKFMEHLKGLFSVGRKAVILMVGTSQFQEINALYGYTFGNKTLVALATRLHELAGDAGLLFRGQGPMLIFCSEQMNQEELRRLYNGVRNYSLHTLSIEGIRLSVRLGGGIVGADDPAVDVHAVLACLKFAQGRSENAAGGEAVILQNAYMSENKGTIELVNAIHTDVEHDCRNFSLCYQPILKMSDSSPLGVAAYLRWECAPYGRISPAELLGWMEKDASFSKLGNWILRQALSETVHLLKEYPGLLVNINLAQRQLEQPEFRQVLLNTLKDASFPGRNLCLELTDRCRFLHPQFLQKEVSFIKSCGTRVALDGSCLLDLHLVRSLPVDIIKIEREFIMNLKRNEKDRSLLKALCGFASESGILVCAEGVEDREVLDMLRTYRIFAYQGYITSPPLPIDEFEAKLKTL